MSVYASKTKCRKALHYLSTGNVTPTQKRREIEKKKEKKKSLSGDADSPQRTPNST